MLSLEEARERILAALALLEPENVPLRDAAGRFAAKTVTSPLDLPLFDNSAMDGYAVRAADLTTASPPSPVPLRLRGTVAAGGVFDGATEPGDCVRLFTGSPLPAGADAVVMQEDTQLDPADPGRVWFREAAPPWSNVRRQGEDVKQGAALLQPGDQVTAARSAVLAAVGLGTVRVTRRPAIALLATGSELVEAGHPLAPGKLYESNRLMLAALLEGLGLSTTALPLVPDTAPATRQALAEAFQLADVVITTGGVSVGEFDLVQAAFADLGGRIVFWKVAIQPGKPFFFGQLGRRCLFGLPGNPVSAFVTFLLLVRPALLRLQGATAWELPSCRTTLADPIAQAGDRRHFVRVRLLRNGQVTSAGTQASHRLGPLAAADGLVDVPPHTTLPAGSTVTVLRWE
jgi:molybdopterin molybdotransferase